MLHYLHVRRCGYEAGGDPATLQAGPGAFMSACHSLCSGSEQRPNHQPPRRAGRECAQLQRCVGGRSTLHSRETATPATRRERGDMDSGAPSITHTQRKMQTGMRKQKADLHRSPPQHCCRVRFCLVST